jgi:calcineurin-like phosphoesterase family protein
VFIRGNHDNNNSTKTLIESIVIKHGGERIYLTHNPKYAKPEFKLNFAGHVHEKWQFQKLDKNSIIVNLSVEMWGYYPVTISEIFQQLSIWQKN